jgi:hypothetical protein
MESFVQQKIFLAVESKVVATPCRALCSTPVSKTMLSSLQVFCDWGIVDEAAAVSFCAKAQKLMIRVEARPRNNGLFMGPPESVVEG